MGNPPLAPLVVGVTGHRDLRQEDLPELRKIVGRVLDEKSSAATPLMLLSPLAEGADRLVANEALLRGAWLVVILPMAQTLYETDFQTQESLDDFHELLANAKTIITLPHVSPTEEIQQQGSHARNLQYALAGTCVARHSHLLLALWDGKEEAGTGGTAQIVGFQRSGRFEEDDLQQAFEQLEEPLGPEINPLGIESGLLVHVITPRAKNPTPEQAFKKTELAPDGEKEDLFFKASAAVSARRNSFNQDLRRLWRHTARTRQIHREYLFPEDQAQRLPESLFILREQQAGADVLAAHFQRWTKATLICMGALVLGAAVAFSYHSTLAPPAAGSFPWALALYALLLVGAIAVHTLAKLHGFHNKFLDYRAVAEGLRVQFYWSVAGIRKPAADHYLRRQRGELEWIRNVLTSWTLRLVPLVRPGDLESVKKHWIEGQATYFRGKIPKNRKFLKILAFARNFLLFANLGVALFEVLSAPQIFPEIRARAEQSAPGLFEPGAVAWRVVIMGLAAVAAALVYGYATTMALADESKQYERMERIYGSALKKGIDPDLLEALGKEALAENGEWVLMHRERPIELPN